MVTVPFAASEETIHVKLLESRSETSKVWSAQAVGLSSSSIVKIRSLLPSTMVGASLTSAIVRVISWVSDVPLPSIAVTSKMYILLASES